MCTLIFKHNETNAANIIVDKQGSSAFTSKCKCNDAQTSDILTQQQSEASTLCY